MTCDITDICFSITWFIVLVSVSVSANLGLYSPKFQYWLYSVYLFWTGTCNLKIYGINITNIIRIDPAQQLAIDIHCHDFTIVYCQRTAFGHLLRPLLSIPTCMLHRLYICIYIFICVCTHHTIWFNIIDLKCYITTEKKPGDRLFID